MHWPSGCSPDMGARNALSALIIVFGVLAILIVVLFALAGLLAYRHAQQRKGFDMGLKDKDLRQDFLNLTMGDLVMDRKLADQVEIRVRRERPAASHGEPDSAGSGMAP
jgi:hypothetical protein